MEINITNLFSYSIINEISFIVVNALVWAAIAVAVVLTRSPLFIPAGRAWTGQKGMSRMPRIMLSWLVAGRSLAQ